MNKPELIGELKSLYASRVPHGERSTIMPTKIATVVAREDYKA